MSVWGRQAGRRARGWTEAELADINILGGTIVIEGVKARANVARRPGKIVRNNRGSAALKITVNGTAYDVPLGGLEIPGVVKIEEGVTTRTKRGIEVVGLRLSLLDGSAAVIDLGIAKANIRGVPKPKNI
ncbi:hypothetical protein MF408_11620 [Nocardioides sp. TF02-7]|nr:hypothetical protein MF408_11620 [Nocardioides sp. TF02-7]